MCYIGTNVSQLEFWLSTFSCGTDNARLCCKLLITISILLLCHNYWQFFFQRSSSCFLLVVISGVRRTMHVKYSFLYMARLKFSCQIRKNWWLCLQVKQVSVWERNNSLTSWDETLTYGNQHKPLLFLLRLSLNARLSYMLFNFRAESPCLVLIINKDHLDHLFYSDIQVR